MKPGTPCVSTCLSTAVWPFLVTRFPGWRFSCCFILPYLHFIPLGEFISSPAPQPSCDSEALDTPPVETPRQMLEIGPHANSCSRPCQIQMSLTLVRWVPKGVPPGNPSWAVVAADGRVPGFTSQVSDGTGSAVSHVETRALTSQHPSLLPGDMRGKKISITVSSGTSVPKPSQGPSEVRSRREMLCCSRRPCDANEK